MDPTTVEVLAAQAIILSVALWAILWVLSIYE